MRQLKSSEYRQRTKDDGKLSVRLNCSGGISFSPKLSALLDIKKEYRVIVTSDDSNNYYIGKALSREDKDGFTIRNFSKSAGPQYLFFSSAQIVNEIKAKHDLALSPEKKKSIVFEVDETPHTWNGITLFQIDFS